MTTGDAGQRVTVQSRTETSDGRDGFTEVWTDVPPRRRAARVRPMVGRDLESARQIDPRISHEVTLWYWRSYQTDFDGGRARIVYHPTNSSGADRTFEVVGPPLDVDERHAELRCLCREVT